MFDIKSLNEFDFKHSSTVLKIQHIYLMPGLDIINAKSDDFAQ